MFIYVLLGNALVVSGAQLLVVDSGEWLPTYETQRAVTNKTSSPGVYVVFHILLLLLSLLNAEDRKGLKLQMTGRY